MKDTDAWLDQDHKRITEDNWWTLSKTGNDAKVYTMKVPNSPLLYLKVEANINCTVQELRSLFDEDLVTRQIEWHHLLIDGFECEQYTKDIGVYYFSYKSTVLFVSPRDTCYVKVRKNFSEVRGEDDEGFLLSYRTMKHPKAPLNPKYVRIQFEGAHMVVPDKKMEGVYIDTFNMRIHVVIYQESSPMDHNSPFY